jgi:hypothetical protein
VNWRVSSIEIVQPKRHASSHLTHYHVVITEQSDLVTIDIEWCCHVSAKGKYLASIERVLMLKFLVIEIQSKQLESSRPQPKAIRLREII